MKALRLAGVIRESIVDGPGIRLVIFAQGCPHKCPGCHNPATHDPEGGYDSDPQQILEAIRENPILQGVTFSGGDPFLQADGFAQLAREIHALGLSVITYTAVSYTHLDVYKRQSISLFVQWKSLASSPQAKSWTLGKAFAIRAENRRNSPA